MNIPHIDIIALATCLAVAACTAGETPQSSSNLSSGVGSAAGVTADPAVGPAQAGSSGQPTTAAQQMGAKGYIGLFGDGTVGVLDVAQKKIIKTLQVSAPDGLVITPDGKQVFVSSTDSGSVKFIATDSDTIVASIDVGAKPAGLAVSPDGSLIVAAVGGADEAVVIDADTHAIVRHAPVPQAHAGCISEDGHLAYVGSQVISAPAILEVNLDADMPPKSFAVDKPPRMLDCQKDRIYFTAIGLDAVEVFDPMTGTLGTKNATGGSPHDVRPSEPGRTELVVSQTDGDLEFIDVASAAVVAKVATGKLAHWITLSADHSHAYVTNEGDDNVAVVDLATQVVTDKIDVGQGPRKMALRP